jgi:hypothetical protein
MQVNWITEICEAIFREPFRREVDRINILVRHARYLVGMRSHRHAVVPLMLLARNGSAQLDSIEVWGIDP